MFADRRLYSFTVETVTPTHVGTGDFREFRKSDESNEPSHMAALVRDGGGKPYLPAPTLKGVFRRAAELIGEGDSDAFRSLMGVIKDSTSDLEKGRMGLLLMRGGRQIGGPPDCSAMPYADRIASKDAFIAARTAIDGATGVAADHQLFFQEMLPAGVGFAVEAVVLRHGSSAQSACDLMDRLLAVAMRDGLQVGKGQADGQGLLRVRPGSAAAVDEKLDGSGDLRRGPRITISPAPDGEYQRRDTVATIHWRAHCAGPFLVADSSHGSGRGADDPSRNKKASGPQISAQRVSRRLPLLLGSSVSGALRARADWLADRAEQNGKLAGAADVAVKELFGTESWRATVEIRNLTVDPGEPFDITSLKIDRFSGAPVDGALFTTSCFVGVSVRFELALLSRGTGPSGDARALFKLLEADLARNGLMLGAGASKGFGWFKLSREDS